jgi:hypothetical protein
MANVVPDGREIRDDAAAAIIDPATHPDYARIERWRTACERGECKYRDEKPHTVPDGCPGYAGWIHYESGQLIARYRNCPRKEAWWRREQAWIRERSGGKRKPETWDGG